MLEQDIDEGRFAVNPQRAIELLKKRDWNQTKPSTKPNQPTQSSQSILVQWDN